MLGMRSTDGDPESRTRVGIDRLQNRTHMIHQGLAIGEKNVCDSLFLGDLPDPLLVVEIGRVLGQPIDLDVLPYVGMIQEGERLLGRMDGPVVQGEDDSLTGSSSTDEQRADEEQELPAILSTFCNPGHQGAVLSRRVVDRPEGSDLAVLTGRGNLHLLPTLHPSASQVRMKMEVGFVLEPEFVSGTRVKSPFFRA